MKDSQVRHLESKNKDLEEIIKDKEATCSRLRQALNESLKKVETVENYWRPKYAKAKYERDQLLNETKKFEEKKVSKQYTVFLVTVRIFSFRDFFLKKYSTTYRL